MEIGQEFNSRHLHEKNHFTYNMREKIFTQQLQVQKQKSPSPKPLFITTNYNIVC